MTNSANQAVSRSYTLAFLATHPISMPIVQQYLGKSFEEAQKVDATLRDLFETNMGGGIPFDTIIALMNDLDALNI